MAVLLGSNAAAVSNKAAGGINEAIWERYGQTAAAGTMATFHIEFNTSNVGNYVKGAVWDSSGVLVASTAAIEATIGEKSVAISGTLSAATYYIGFLPDNQVDFSTVNADSYAMFYETGNNYATPAAITLPGTGLNGGTIRAWIEDAGGATITTSGSLQADAATVSGTTVSDPVSLAVFTTITTAGRVSGSVQADTASVSGTLNVISTAITTSGSLQADNATASGSVNSFTVIQASGSVQADNSTVSGIIDIIATAPSLEGLEYTMPTNRVQYTLPDK